MRDLVRCEFQVIRYVPDAVKGEFTNIGVLLREAGGGETAVRLTRSWSRVRCLDAEVDVAMLEALESELGRRVNESGTERGLLEVARCSFFQCRPDHGYEGLLRGEFSRGDGSFDGASCELAEDRARTAEWAYGGARHGAA